MNNSTGVTSTGVTKEALDAVLKWLRKFYAHVPLKREDHRFTALRQISPHKQTGSTHTFVRRPFEFLNS